MTTFIILGHLVTSFYLTHDMVVNQCYYAMIFNVPFAENSSTIAQHRATPPKESKN